MISYRDDLSVLENIDKFAQSRGLDRSNYIRQAMRQFLRQEADALK
jgi:metal-responsive CopG/Arc/MetJ family transcriptional regulator